MTDNHTPDHPQHSDNDDKICTCASFFTVRGTHKPDCPQHSVREEMIERWEDRFYKEWDEGLSTNPGDVVEFINSLVERVERETREKMCLSPCDGCAEGHPSFWKTVTESDEWAAWERSNPPFDVDESRECGWLSASHFAAFLEFAAAMRSAKE